MKEDEELVLKKETARSLLAVYGGLFFIASFWVWWCWIFFWVCFIISFLDPEEES